MPFMVIYRTSDGSSCFEQADAIDEAALFVERLRNKEGIDQIRIYRMEEISFAFRPYYKVELGLGERQNTPPPPAAASTADVPEGAEPDADEVAGAEVEPPSADDEVTVDDPSDDVTDVRAESALPAPPPPPEGEPAGANGRRGLFGR